MQFFIKDFDFKIFTYIFLLNFSFLNNKMASIRDIKKDINFLADQLIIECFSFLEYSPLNHQENVLDIMYDAEQLRRNLLYKVNSTPENGTYKEYFREIVKEMYDINLKLLEELNSLNE
jgi:hypothetical protein